MAFIVYASVDWNSFDFSLSISSDENSSSSNLSEAGDSSDDFVASEEDDRLWIDTVMYAKGHAFGYSGDISTWGGWYIDTIFVGDDNMPVYDSVGPSSLRFGRCSQYFIHCGAHGRC